MISRVREKLDRQVVALHDNGRTTDSTESTVKSGATPCHASFRSSVR